jgi:uncharacterized membrane protein
MWEKILSELLVKHRGKTIGVGLGLIASILLVSFGFWKTLLIVLCIALGYLLGKRVDDEKNIEEWLKKLLKEK